MRKLVIGMTVAASLMLAGALAWDAQATTLAGHPETSHSLVQKAACWLPGLPGECEVGQHKVCNRFGNRCHCDRCPGWYPWRDYKPAH
jgi:hypothetical protein